MQYISAEREGDWPLHLAAVKVMLPLFFARGYFNYARYATYYLESMETLPTDVLNPFLKVEHTMRHKSGILNGIFSDMAIETTYMHYGHGQNGIIGLTLKPETLKTWTYSTYACNAVVSNINEIKRPTQRRTGE